MWRLTLTRRATNSMPLAALNSMLRPSFLVLSSFGLAILAIGAEKKAPADFDLNRDGRLDLKEFTEYQIAVRDPKFSELDKNKDGQITQKEKEDWALVYWSDVQTHLVRGGAPLDLVKTTVPQEKPKTWAMGPFHLRKDHDSLLKDLDKADPATGGFYRDNLTSQDTWAVQGAFGAVFDIYNPKELTKIGGYALDPIRIVPSVTLNRVTGKGDGSLEIVDSLVYRGSVAFGLQTTDERSTLWDYQLFTGTFRSSGTTENGNYKSAGEAQWEPMRNRQGDWISINGPEQPPAFWKNAPFFYRFAMTARTEFGDSPVVQFPGTFFKVGPSIGLTLIPRFLPSLELYANYTYLWELNNSSRDFELFEAGGRFALDRNKQGYLEAKYQWGQVPANYTDIDLFQVSLAVKF